MTALVILAAGASSRLGQPKQNLLFQDETLLQRAVSTALATNCSPVMVVLGANAALIEPTISYENIVIINNPGWQEGMASSIRIAISAIINNTEIQNALIMLCDQPFVSSELIGEMLQKQNETNQPIIACRYNDGVTGVPVLFNRSLFAELLLLKGNEGAKHMLKHYYKDTVTVPFESGGIDIDTMDDYEKLIS